VNILDENIHPDQRRLLLSWRVRVRQIGHDFGRKGLQDEAIISLLRQGRRLTFFTRDLGFYDRGLCHRRYCVVCLDVRKYETALFIRRTLGQPKLNTQARRMGSVVRVSQRYLRVWRLHSEREERLDWL
jgi:hypothetical protein